MRNIKSETFCFAILLCVTTFVGGHEGHDHGSHDHAAEPSADAIPESDSAWTTSDIHSLKFNGFALRWKQDPSDPKSVLMKMAASTTGYVAVGFCPVWAGGMDGCDIILGWVDGSGKPHVYDYFAPGNTFPSLDKNQSVQVVSGTDVNGITGIVFKRLWDTGDDEKDANLLHNQNVHVIYAWDDQDPISATDFRKHEDGKRGHTLSSVPIQNHQHNAGKLLETSFVTIITMMLVSLTGFLMK